MTVSPVDLNLISCICVSFLMANAPFTSTTPLAPGRWDNGRCSAARAYSLVRQARNHTVTTTTNAIAAVVKSVTERTSVVSEPKSKASAPRVLAKSCRSRTGFSPGSGTSVIIVSDSEPRDLSMAFPSAGLMLWQHARMGRSYAILSPGNICPDRSKMDKARPQMWGAIIKPVPLDLENPDTFVTFVAAAAVDLRYPTRSEAAGALRMKPSNLSTALRGNPSPELLRRIERLYLSSGDTSHHGAPWLTTFKAEMDQSTPLGAAETVVVPSGWYYNLAANPPRNSTEAFVRAHALRAWVREAAEADPGADVERALETFGLAGIGRATIDSLLEVVGGPPHTALPAVQLVASLGPLMLKRVANFIKTSPVGFRAIRVLGRALAEHGASPADDDPFVRAVGTLLHELHERGPVDPYPARSFVVEALRYAPKGEAWAWVTDALEKRTEAESPHGLRPVRERAYAAYALQDRESFDEARKVADRFAKSEDPGLRYAAAFLELGDPANSERPAYPWPTDRIEHGIVDAATLHMEMDMNIPVSVRAGLRLLTRGALLSIDGTQRRRICECIQASRLAPTAIEGIDGVINNRSSPDWLIEQAVFISGYLQTGLADGANYTSERLAFVLSDDARHTAGSRHAAAWALGDVLGSLDKPPDPDQYAKLISERERKEEHVSVRRALSYAAAMLSRRAPLDDGGVPYLGAALDGFAQDRDKLVRNLAIWAQEIQRRRGENRGYLAWAESGDVRE